MLSSRSTEHYNGLTHRPFSSPVIGTGTWSLHERMPLRPPISVCDQDTTERWDRWTSKLRQRYLLQRRRDRIESALAATGLGVLAMMVSILVVAQGG